MLAMWFSLAGLVFLVLGLCLFGQQNPDKGDRFMGIVLSLFASGVFSFGWYIYGQGGPRVGKRVGANEIYEVLSTAPVDERRQLIILRDRDGDCLMYSWEGQVPKGIVKAIKDGDSPNEYKLVPFPSPPSKG